MDNIIFEKLSTEELENVLGGQDVIIIRPIIDCAP